MSPNLLNMPNPIRQDLHTVDDTSFSYIFEQNATVELKSSDGLVRCNVYRPKGSSPEERVPVLVTYGPYGKDTSYGEQVVRPNPEMGCQRGQTNVTHVLVFTRNRSPRSTRSTSLPILPGRLLTPDFGPAMGTLSYARTREALVNPLECSTQCPAGPARLSLK